jgi:predicted DNA-binding protein (UPF0251 family)
MLTYMSRRADLLAEMDTWRIVVDSRDNLIRRAVAAQIEKVEIAERMKISRQTVDKVIGAWSRQQ